MHQAQFESGDSDLFYKKRGVRLDSRENGKDKIYIPY